MVIVICYNECERSILNSIGFYSNPVVDFVFTDMSVMIGDKRVATGMCPSLFVTEGNVTKMSVAVCHKEERHC